MKVWGVDESTLCTIAQKLSVTLYETRKDGRALRFGLRPTGERNQLGNYRYQRISTRGTRRVHAVCWHGHRDFMREVFRHNANARIKTMWADYKGSVGNQTGAENFEATHGVTAYKNVGSMMYPAFACDICTCETSDTNVSVSRTMKQSDIAACPFVIFDLSHYRADGSCKCNDPVERLRMIREWGYSESDFKEVAC